MRTIIFILGMFLYLVITLPLLVVYKLTKNKRIADFFGRNIGKLGNLLAGNHVKVVNKHYLDNAKPCLIISNHEGIFDAFNIYANINQSFGIVSKKENKSIPLLGLWTGAMDVFLMDRDDVRQSMRVIKEASEKLSDGLSVVIFPEGTRSKLDQEFHGGSFKIATKAQADIICITMRNTSAIFEDNKKIKSASTLMHVHKPITYDEYKDLDSVSLAKKMEEIVYGVKFEQ